MDIEIAPVSMDRVPIVAAMTARAFLDEPLLRWPLGDVPDPPAAIESEFIGVETVAAECGCLWEAGDAIGAASWIRPDAARRFWDETETVSAGRGIAEHAEDGGRRNRLLWEWIAGHYTDEPSWFLDMVGVDPLRQGGGVGSLLIEYGLRFARDQGLPASLETSSPQLVGYYERFGFAVTDEGDAPGGGPHVWFMRSRVGA